MSDRVELTPENEERLARYRAGAMSEAERTEFEREALASDALTEALYREISLGAVVVATRSQTAAAAVPLATPAPSRRPRSILEFPGARVLLPIAAGVLVVSGVALWSASHRAILPVGDELRGGGGAIVLIEPAGSIARTPQQFRWTRDPGAASYRVELYDQRATRLGTAVTTDTSLSIERLTSQPITAGEWRVVALGADGLERANRARAAFSVDR